MNRRRRDERGFVMTDEVVMRHQPRVPRPHLAQEMRERGAEAPELTRFLRPGYRNAALGISTKG